jgi:hypothetical protein
VPRVSSGLIKCAPATVPHQMLVAIETTVTCLAMKVQENP